MKKILIGLGFMLVGTLLLILFGLIISGVNWFLNTYPLITGVVLVVGVVLAGAWFIGYVWEN